MTLSAGPRKVRETRRRLSKSGGWNREHWVAEAYFQHSYLTAQAAAISFVR